MRVFDESFELLEFVVYAVYVNLQNDEISLVITARFMNACGVCSVCSPNCPSLVGIWNNPVSVLRYDSPVSLSTHFNDYFIEKIEAIREEFPILQLTLPNYVCPESSTTCEPTNCQFLDFTPVTLPEIKTISSQMNITT